MRADPTPTYGGQNALGWANERGDDASAQLLIELHMVAEEEQRASFLALQHGDSAVLEGPQLALCASSGRASWLWVAQHFQ